MCAHTMKDTWYAHGLNNTNEKYKQEEEKKKLELNPAYTHEWRSQRTHFGIFTLVVGP